MKQKFILLFILVSLILFYSCSIRESFDSKNTNNNFYVNENMTFLNNTNIIGILKFIGNEPFTKLAINNNVIVLPKNLSNDLIGCNIVAQGNIYFSITFNVDHSITITNYYLSNITKISTN